VQRIACPEHDGQTKRTVILSLGDGPVRILASEKLVRNRSQYRLQAKSHYTALDPSRCH